MIIQVMMMKYKCHTYSFLLRCIYRTMISLSSKELINIDNIIAGCLSSQECVCMCVSPSSINTSDFKYERIESRKKADCIRVLLSFAIK